MNIDGTDADSKWMQVALEQAALAGKQEEVPVGAVIVSAGEVLGLGYNQPRSSKDPSAHAEIIALRGAAAAMKNYRLPGSTLYVTIEPCTMCVGALVHARVERLVFGATEPKAGAVCSQAQLLDADFMNHKVHWQGGVLEAESSTLMQAFFKSRR